WRRLLTDPATGRLIDYGTTRYTPPQDLRDVIIARDQTCVFPTCSQPAHLCQIDHTIAYPDGPTSQANTGPPCGIHHDLKTHRGWLVEQPEEGLFIWTSPVGKRYENEPPQVGPIIETAPPNDNSASAGPPTTEGPDPPDVPPSDQRFEPRARALTNDDVGSGILLATAGAGAPSAHRTARRWQRRWRTGASIEDWARR
ncbi:MAG TPA: hypothetical protein VGK55_04800, partial [Actinomycetes bacterium]